MAPMGIRRRKGAAVKVEECRRGEETAIRHCPARRLCPLGALCAGGVQAGESPLFPTAVELEPGELLWADLRFEQRAFVIQTGIFACISNLEQCREIPLALLGSGHTAGLAELYIPREIASTYYLRALTGGRACSFPAKALRRHLEALPSATVADLLSCTLVNTSSASYAQIKMLSKPLASDRITMLLARLKELAGQEGRDLTQAKLTHSDIATLISSDRVSVTRALHKMEEGGLVELGYRSLQITEGIDGCEELVEDAKGLFHRPAAE